MYETFEHTADIGIRGIGGSFPEAFTEAARCVFSIMAELSSDLYSYSNDINVTIESRAYNLEELFIDFINRLIYESAVNKCIFTDFEVMSFSETALIMKVSGEKMKTSNKHILKSEIKAATYCQLKVYRDNNRYIAQCVVDV